MSTEEIRAQTYVGFDSITQQIEHKLLKRGFQFNVIVVGELFVFLVVFCVCVGPVGSGSRDRKKEDFRDFGKLGACEVGSHGWIRCLVFTFHTPDRC